MGILSSLLGIGQSAPTPVAPQSITTTELAKEVAPFMKDLLAKGQALYKQRTEEGFQPYTGPTIAQLTPEQLQAREGLTSLVGTQAPTFAKAQELTEGVAEEMTPTALEPFMSPYQQAVTDIEKAEAQKTFERDVLPKVRQAQIGAGAFGGTRGTMLEAQALADQQKLLGDIQTRGSQAAYQDAVRAFEAQKAREGQTAGALAQLAPAAFRAQTGEQALLETIGKEDQMRSQQALDEAYKQYLEERVFPERTLGQYQSVIAGFPSASVTRTTTAAPQPQQSGLGSLLSGALNLGNIYGTFGGFTKGGFGSAYTPYGRAEGGPVVEKQYGGEVGTGGLVGLTDDGTQIFERTQEGILNRALHGGILEGYNQQTSTATGENIIGTPDGTGYTLPGFPSPDSPSEPYIPPSGLVVQTGQDKYGNLVGDLTGTKDYYDLNFAAQDAGQDTFMYGDKLMQVDPGYLRGGGINPFISNRLPAGLQQEITDSPHLFTKESFVLGVPNLNTIQKKQGDPTDPSFYKEAPYLPTEDFTRDISGKYNSYYEANQAAKEAGSPTFMWGDKLAKTDPGLLPDYSGPPKPFISNAVPEKYLSAGVYLPPGWSNMPASEIAKRQPGYVGDLSYYERIMRGLPGKTGGQIKSLKGGGLVSLPVVKRQAGNQVFTLPSSPALPEGMDLETLQKLPPSVQQQMLTGNLYNIYQAQMQQDEARKAMEEQDMAAEAARVAEDIDARKSAAIGAMLGSFAKGMKTRAGQGFGQEILGGLEGAAETSTEISEKDRAAIDAAETKLRADRKAAAKEWDKGNRDRALELLTIANTNYSLKLEELKAGRTAMSRKKAAIQTLTELQKEVRTPQFDEMAKLFVESGDITKDELERIFNVKFKGAGDDTNLNQDIVISDEELELDPDKFKVDNIKIFSGNTTR